MWVGQDINRHNSCHDRPAGVLWAMRQNVKVLIRAGDIYSPWHAGDIDVFLGNWCQPWKADICPYREAKTVDTVRENLEGAKYTLAPMLHGAKALLTDFCSMLRTMGCSWKERSTPSSPAMMATG